MNNINRLQLINYAKELHEHLIRKKPHLDTQQFELAEKLDMFLRHFEAVFSSALRNDIDDSLVTHLLNYWGETNRVNSALYRLFIDKIGEPTSVFAQVESFLSSIYNPIVPMGKDWIPFIYIASYILSLDAKDIDVGEIGHLRESVSESKKDVDNLLVTLRTEASRVTAARFAKIFGDQAKRHSYFSLRPKHLNPWKNHFFGAAERWLLFLFFNLIAIPIVILCYKVEPTFEYITDKTFVPFLLGVIPKLTIIATLLFLARFSLKSYNTNKSLHISNIHRQNVLNSFRLLYDTLPKENSEARTKLLEEVGKAIFLLGKNPYNDQNKSDKLDLNALSELLKLARSP